MRKVERTSFTVYYKHFDAKGIQAIVLDINAKIVDAASNKGFNLGNKGFGQIKFVIIYKFQKLKCWRVISIEGEVQIQDLRYMNKGVQPALLSRYVMSN